MSMEKEPNTIECVNFQMSGNNPSIKELMEGLVFSPSSRFAVNFQRTLKQVTGIFILDTDSKKFCMYEADDTENDLGLKMDIFYWYGEECLIFVYGHGRDRKFHQTPIVLNHQKRSFAVKETRFYNWSPFGGGSFKNPLLPSEATTIQLGGEKYVFWCAYWPLDPAAHAPVYLIPHTPNSNKKMKKFYMPFYEWHTNEMSKIIGLDGPTNLWWVGLDLQIVTIGNVVYFPCRREWLLDNKEQHILGFYLAIDFNKMIDTYDMNVNDRDRQGMIDFWKRQEESRQIIEIVPQSATFSTQDSFLTELGIHRKLGKVFISLIKEQTSHGNLTKLFYMDCESQTIRKVYEEVDPDGGAMAICLTPYNLLFANEVSETKIRYRTLPLPTGNQLLSLKETLMRHVYFTDLQKSFYPSL